MIIGMGMQFILYYLTNIQADGAASRRFSTNAYMQLLPW